MANPTVLLETTSGDILIELYADKAPATVENFLKYVNEGFYANTIFHRVIKGFMIQGGGMNMKMEEKATHAPIKNEADNGLANERGTIAMARTRDPHSATAQFFINTVDNGFLNFSSPDVNGYGYCVFQVIFATLLRVRQGHRRHGSRRQDRKGKDHHPRHPFRCAGFRRAHHQRQRV